MKIVDMEVPTVFMGTPEFAVAILESLINSSYPVVAAYTQPDKPVGRRQQLAWSPVKSLATQYKIPIVQPQTLKSAEAVKQLASFEPQLIIVAAFGYILPQEVLSLPRFGCLNVHPSLLPRHRGPSPIANALLSGDKLTGVTIMLMDAGMDSGPIVAQRQVAMSSEDTTGSLTARLADAGAELLLDTLPKWLEGKLKPRPQDEAEATYSKLITKEDGEINWHLPAAELWRRVRAFSPWPGCYAWWQGKRLIIHKAIPLSQAGSGEPGKVVALPKAAPVEVGVMTGEGILGLCQVQLEGKRQMLIADFVRGQRDFIGSTLS